MCDEEVDDIKQKYREPLDMRLAMMRRWKELEGREATYLKLVDGLMQVGRRDLIEVVLEWRMKKISWIQEWVAGGIGVYIFLLVSLCMFSILFYKSITESKAKQIPDSKNENPSCVFCLEEASDIQFDSRLDAFNYTNKSCSNMVLTDGELPILHKEIFVGRDSDVREVLFKITRTNIVNINGAPGFGKSALAKHIGHDILSNGTLVQYINVEQKLLLFYDSFVLTDSDHGVKSEFFKQKHETRSLVELGGSSMETLTIGLSKKYHHHFIDELIKWSEAINCYTVLILDNCDDILASSVQDKFSDLIKSLVRNSHFKLHVIITSRLKLLYIDWFDSWTVKELNISASIELLDKMAPGIDADNLEKIAEVVGGCPLALKVIGQLLHTHGAQLIHKVKNELMVLLDNASDKRERFPLIMDVAFSRLGTFKECGYRLSLFPGSFDKSAANAVIAHEKECIELYVRHSLMEEYFVPYQQRYDMHRLIREFLRAKLYTNDETKFNKAFRDHVVHFLLTYAKKPEVDSIGMHILSSELHNIYYLKTILLNETKLSAEELAAMAFISNFQNLIQYKHLFKYFPLYMQKLNDVCTLLNPQLCGELYSQIVKHLYQQCKCETFTEYVKNFYVSSCMEHFQCDAVEYFIDLLNTTKMDRLSPVEKSFINRMANYHCYAEASITMMQQILITIVLFNDLISHCRTVSDLGLGKCFTSLKVISIILTVLSVTLQIRNFLYIKKDDHVNQLILVEIVIKLICSIIVILTMYGVPFVLYTFYNKYIIKRYSLSPVVVLFLIIIIILSFILISFCNFKLHVYQCPFLPICQ